MLIKYCKREHNPKINLLSGVRLGTVPSYREGNINSGTFDDEEGVLNYISDGDVPLTADVSKIYFDNSILCDGNNGLEVGKTNHLYSFNAHLSNGDDGWLRFHATRENPIVMNVSNTFFIYSCSVDDAPSIEKARLIDLEYDSFYEISEIHSFAQRLANELKSRALNFNVNFERGLVDYSSEKFEFILNGRIDMERKFSDRVLKTIFNKNTRHNHVYQKEYRIVFWFSDPFSGEWSSIPRSPIVIRPMHIRKDIGLFV